MMPTARSAGKRASGSRSRSRSRRSPQPQPQPAAGSSSSAEQSEWVARGRILSLSFSRCTKTKTTHRTGMSQTGSIQGAKAGRSYYNMNDPT